MSHLQTKKNSVKTEDKVILPKYVGMEIPNCDYTHGLIAPFPGVKNYQLVRANRTYPKLADNTSTTYKHAPDITFFNGRFYVQYLVNDKDEHEQGGFSILASFERPDGEIKFETSFPKYRIRKCTITDYKGIVHEYDGNSYAFMHQRMSFFKSSEGRLLLLGFYGFSPEKWMTNWDNYGIGRVVREIRKDGSLSDIFFIRPNYQAGWSEDQLEHPMYTKATDEGFVKACDELLADRLYTQQWAEENGDADDIITVKHPKGGTNQAFCWYNIDDKRVVGLWKHSKVAGSNDNGATWSEVKVEPSLIMSGQKIWGQKCKDDLYALIYDPTLESTHRYPMCMITSKDGESFDNMKLICGEVAMKRYAGFWKDYGAQYMRGITPGLTKGEKMPSDSCYLVYSLNKEDIWLAVIPVCGGKVTDSLANEADWNLYAPKFTKHVIDAKEGFKLEVWDKDPVDHFVATHVLKSACQKEISLSLLASPTEDKPVYLELLDDNNIEAVRIVFRANGTVYVRTTDYCGIGSFNRDEIQKVYIKADCERMCSEIEINGQKGEFKFYRAVHNISALKVSTGKLYESPKLSDDPEAQNDLPSSTESMLKEACEFKIVIPKE